MFEKTHSDENMPKCFTQYSYSKTKKQSILNRNDTKLYLGLV